jgi:hypothetical protein
MAEIAIAFIQFLADILLQVFAEVVAEFGLEAIREAIRPSRPGQPVFAALGYVLLGALFALLSLWPLPDSFSHHTWLRIVNLLISPAVAGLAMVALGRWRIQRGQGGIYLHRFGYGFLFAFTFALVRFACTQV